jgi:hypothetical protein
VRGRADLHPTRRDAARDLTMKRKNKVAGSQSILKPGGIAWRLGKCDKASWTRFDATFAAKRV